MVVREGGCLAAPFLGLRLGLPRFRWMLERRCLSVSAMVRALQNRADFRVSHRSRVRCSLPMTAGFVEVSVRDQQMIPLAMDIMNSPQLRSDPLTSGSTPQVVPPSAKKRVIAEKILKNLPLRVRPRCIPIMRRVTKDCFSSVSSRVDDLLCSSVSVCFFVIDKFTLPRRQCERMIACLT